jgi:hypothetical protein
VPFRPGEFLAVFACQESTVRRLSSTSSVNGASRCGKLARPPVRTVRVAPVGRPNAVIAVLALVTPIVASRPALGQQAMTTSPQLGYDQGETPSVRALGMGGALNALGVSTAALSLNPANMPLARVYHFEAFGAFSPEAKRQTYGLAVVDSILNSSRVAGGVEGSWSEMDPDVLHRTWTDLRAGLGLPLGDHVAVGATGRWLRIDQAVAAGPFGHSLASGGTNGAPLVNMFTFDAGATAAIGESLRIGIVGHNLTNPGTSFAPTTGALGIGYGTHDFALEADGLLDFTTFGSVRGRLMAGGEVFLADRYAVRAGWRYDAGTRVNTPSIGLGYIDPRWSVEIGVRRDLVSDHGSTFGMLSLRYFYDATGATTPADQADTL